jgi:ribose transport system ATP-binding protein
MRRSAQSVLDALGFHLAAGDLLGDLTIGQQQLEATARATMRRCRVIIFDEPTAYLARRETEQLFALICRLRAEGTAVVYISHRLEEIFELADHVSVLRDGVLVSSRPIGEVSEAQLIQDMVNRRIDDVHYKAEVAAGEVLLQVDGLSGPGFEEVDLTVRRGEVVGLFGLIGAGRSEFVQCLFGRTARRSGTIVVKGRRLRGGHEAEAIEAGLALVPESRRLQGLCLNLPVRLNLALTTYDRISIAGFIDRHAEQRLAERNMSRLRIIAPHAEADVAALSGGNQQKIVIGKWLERGADLFIFDEPTVGVDVGTKHEIYRLMASLLANGAGVILISSYLPEVYDISDRILVMNRGRVVASYDDPRAHSHEDILAKAIGA